MRSYSWPNWQFGLCLSIALAALIVGTGRCSLRAEADVDQDPAEPGMLVMTSGRVVSGRILRNGQDYLVKTPTGQMFVPSSMVRLRSTNIQDAYRQLRLAFPENHGPESHMSLARWCITQRLYSDARQELKDALMMEPDRAEAQDMLQRLNAMVDPTTAESLRDAPAVVEATHTVTRNEDAESLGGLPHDLAVRFTGRIQPLLNANCALSGCHGYQEESREFRMQKFATGDRANRHSVERNLANILKFIDLDNPRESLLLTKPKGNHGRRGKTIFVGPRGASQYSDLKDWVVNVAANREEPGAGNARKVTTKRGSGRIRTTSLTRPAGEKTPTETPAAEPDLFPELTRRRNGNKSTKLSNDEPKLPASTPPEREPQGPAPATNEKDPFDPAEFNRQVGK